MTGSKLLKEVEKRRGGLKQDRIKLADTGKQLKHSQESKSAINEKVSQFMSRLEELREKVRRIVHQREILRIELQSKQKEYQLLSEKDKSLSEKDAVISSRLREKIEWKQKEIESLEKELEKKESDLESAQIEAKRQQKQLSKAQAELKEKCKEVEQLKEANEKLSCSYNIKKEQVSKLFQLTDDLTSDKRDIEVSFIYILCIKSYIFFSPLATTG